ncbi:MAG: hypothetical protein EOP51_32540, partial [Sphingobacteriales bacterium]
MTSSLQGGTAPFNYNWEDPAGNALPNEPNPFVASPIAGVYKLRATDSKGCPADADINIILGNPNVDGLQVTKKCADNLIVNASGLIPNSINLKLYYQIIDTVANPDLVIKTDSALVNADADGNVFFSLPSNSINNYNRSKLVIDRVSNGSCSADINISVKLGPGLAVNSWRGTLGNKDWHSDANWCPSTPGYRTDVIVPQDSVIYIRQNQIAICQKLTLNARSKLVIEEGAVLIIYGTLAVGANANIDARQGTIQLMHNDNVPINGRWFADSSIRNLIISPYNPIPTSREFKLRDTSTMLRITNLLELADTLVDLKTNNKLVMASTSTGTARIGKLAYATSALGNTIIDSVVVERYIAPGRKWRFLSVPTTTAQTFK